jgi:hypothetical protein
MTSLYRQDVDLKIYIHEFHLPQRLQLLKNFDFEYVLLLDQDVELKSRSCLREMIDFLSARAEPCLLTGLYESPPSSSYLCRAYNFLSSNWALTNSQTLGDFRSLSIGLGGIWFLRHSPTLKLDFSHLDGFWGGEDALSIVCKIMASKFFKVIVGTFCTITLQLLVSFLNEPGFREELGVGVDYCVQTEPRTYSL